MGKSTDGSTGSMTTGFAPVAGSFSVTFFVSLKSNGRNYGHLAATGNPYNGNSSNGWNIDIDESATNNVFAKFGYGSGQKTVYGPALPLNAPVSVTLTYNASSKVGTLCVGSTSSPKCATGTLPAAYVASGKPIVFGGGTFYDSVAATFDEAAYWQNTVITSAQIGAIAAYAGSGGAKPTPPPSVGFNDYLTFGYNNGRDVYNPNSTTLTPASLANLHLAWQASAGDYNTQSQPILATEIPGHAGVLFIGGGSGKVYGFDALTGAKLWTRPTGQETYACENGQTIYFGVGGSAAYDPASKSLYIVGNSNASPNAKASNVLFHLDGASGNILGQVDFAPTQAGPTDLDFSHTSVTLNGGLAYVGTSATCDISSWRGRVASISVPSMQLAKAYFTVWNGTTQPWGGGGVWGWGGVSIDPSGYVYTGVGNTDNGTTSHGSIQPPFKAAPKEYSGLGDAFVKFAGDLSTLKADNHPIPDSAFSGASVDLDMQGTPALFTPNGLGCPQMAALQGKSGSLYLYNTNDISGGVVGQYALAPSTYADGFLGGPAYSPATGLLYAAVTSSGGSLYAPGMVGIDPGCGKPAILWHSAFGPDSYPSGVPRSVPAVSAGGIVFVGTPCTPDGNGGCSGSAGTTATAAVRVRPQICCAPPGSGRGALWALDASTGAVLNGGKPLIYTNAPLRVPPTIDGNWVFVLDNSGNMYGLTLDPNFTAISTQTRAVDARMLRSWENQPRSPS